MDENELIPFKNDVPDFLNRLVVEAGADVAHSIFITPKIELNIDVGADVNQ